MLRKTKPTQHSVRGLRGLGSIPNILACRSSMMLDENAKEKLSQFCHVPAENIITLYDDSNIWHIPLMLKAHKAHEGVLRALNLLRFLVFQPDRHVSVTQLESILNHSFRDSSFLVEALTHGSYQLQEIPRCYQRLEFLGDSVLDYLITYFMYTKYPGISPGQITNLRSSAVNNDCYALAAIKSGLHKHILHMSSLLHEQIKNFMASNDHLLLVDTCGWESETSVPKVLGDIIESLAGAILIDSGYDKETVWKCIRPILEPLATLDSMKIQPVVELENLCRSEGYENEIKVGCVDGESSITVEVKVNGVLYSDTRSGMKKKEGKKLAAKAVLKMLKENMAKNC